MLVLGNQHFLTTASSLKTKQSKKIPFSTSYPVSLYYSCCLFSWYMSNIFKTCTLKYQNPSFFVSCKKKNVLLKWLKLIHSSSSSISWYNNTNSAGHLNRRGSHFQVIKSGGASDPINSFLKWYPAMIFRFTQSHYWCFTVSLRPASIDWDFRGLPGLYYS